MSKIEVDAIDKQSGSTLTLGGSGTAVTLACGATQSGFGRTGTVDWVTSVKTNSDSPLTVANGKGYFLNTTSGTITVNLPAGSAGDIVAFKDYANTWDDNNVTITPNGSDKINGFNASAVLSTESQSVTLIFVDSTKGWVDIHDSTADVTGITFISASGGTETNSPCGNFKIHTFTGPGTFTVSCTASAPANNIVSYLVVAGGGGGGGYFNGAGGAGGGGAGAGGYREFKGPADTYTASPLNGNPGGTSITVTAQAYPIAVGAGGAGGPTGPSPSPPTSGVEGAKGVDSTFSTVTSAGGGGGFWRNGGGTPTPSSGGSGGGGGSDDSSPVAVGQGNTPPVTPPQGQNAGTNTGSGPFYGGAGGGGAGAVGSNGTNSAGGAGGTGVSSSITGSSVTRAGGGGGGAYQTGTVGAGGSGGGGAGANNGGTSGSGTVNTGGGAGGVGTQAPGTPFGTTGNGGSGIVVIRYKFQ